MKSAIRLQQHVWRVRVISPSNNEHFENLCAHCIMRNRLHKKSYQYLDGVLCQPNTPCQQCQTDQNVLKELFKNYG